jgi:hypothetical protein
LTGHQNGDGHQRSDEDEEFVVLLHGGPQVDQIPGTKLGSAE